LQRACCKGSFLHLRNGAGVLLTAVDRGPFGRTVRRVAMPLRTYPDGTREDCPCNRQGARNLDAPSLDRAYIARWDRHRLAVILLHVRGGTTDLADGDNNGRVGDRANLTLDGVQLLSKRSERLGATGVVQREANRAATRRERGSY
jgi:hypothetical protein